MRKTLILILALLAVAGSCLVRSCLVQQQQVPTRRILPVDVVQNSIKQSQKTTNIFMLSWTYTEAGAKKMLAFYEAHEGQKVRTVIGVYETPPHEFMFRPMPPNFTNYAQWKEGWLKNRGDQFFGVSEDDAKKILAGLKSK